MKRFLWWLVGASTTIDLLKKCYDASEAECALAKTKATTLNEENIILISKSVTKLKELDTIKQPLLDAIQACQGVPKIEVESGEFAGFGPVDIADVRRKIEVALANAERCIKEQKELQSWTSQS